MNTKIGLEGAIVLTKALETNTSITEINLSGNKIGPEGAIAIAKALEVNTSITEIHFDNNNIGSEGAITLAKVLETNTSITGINLDGGNIEQGIYSKIMLKVKENIQISQLNDDLILECLISQNEKMVKAALNFMIDNYGSLSLDSLLSDMSADQLFHFFNSLTKYRIDAFSCFNDLNPYLSKLDTNHTHSIIIEALAQKVENKQHVFVLLNKLNLEKLSTQELGSIVDYTRSENGVIFEEQKELSNKVKSYIIKSLTTTCDMATQTDNIEDLGVELAGAEILGIDHNFEQVI